MTAEMLLHQRMATSLLKSYPLSRHKFCFFNGLSTTILSNVFVRTPSKSGFSLSIILHTWSTFSPIFSDAVERTDHLASSGTKSSAYSYFHMLLSCFYHLELTSLHFLQKYHLASLKTIKSLLDNE